MGKILIRSLSIILGILLWSCHPSMDPLCQGSSARACCFIRFTDVEATLGIRAKKVNEKDFGWYSTCTFEPLSRRRKKDKVILTWYHLDKSGKLVEKAKKLKYKLKNPGRKDLNKIFKINGRALWQKNSAPEFNSMGVLYVIKEEAFFKIRAPVRDKHPDYFNPRELARWVLRHLKKAQIISQDH